MSSVSILNAQPYMGIDCQDMTLESKQNWQTRGGSRKTQTNVTLPHLPHHQWARTCLGKDGVHVKDGCMDLFSTGHKGLLSPLLCWNEQLLDLLGDHFRLFHNLRQTSVSTRILCPAWVTNTINTALMGCASPMNKWHADDKQINGKALKL